MHGGCQLLALTGPEPAPELCDGDDGISRKIDPEINFHSGSPTIPNAKAVKQQRLSGNNKLCQL